MQFTKADIYSKYRLGSKLGSGGFSSVRKARDRESRALRAIKTLRKSKMHSAINVDLFVNEILMLRQMDHPHILKIYDLLEDKKYYHVVTELCSGGELFDYILDHDGLTEALASHIMQQVLSVVAYCHRNNIIHRDLKPENLLLVKPGELTIKVIDFGTACRIRTDQRLHLALGSSYYIAPEVMRQSYSKGCDVWSCGVILYILLAGYPPFNGENEEEIRYKVSQGHYKFHKKAWSVISDEAKDLITQMLQMKESDRITAEDALQHPWIIRHEKRMSTTSQHQLALKNLKRFRAECKLQQAFLHFFAEQLINQDDTTELGKIFQDLDQNKDGRLSRDELYRGYLKICRDHKKAQAEVDQMMTEADTDNSGYIDYTEFIIATMNKKRMLSKKNLGLAFAAFDNDCSGSISVDELRAMLGVRANDQVIRDLIAQADSDGNGEISMQEFQDLMLKVF